MSQSYSVLDDSAEVVAQFEGHARTAFDADPAETLILSASRFKRGVSPYCAHPILKTPNLDAMAANGLRFDRFYAGAPVCSPTRATVLTGRSNDRTGVPGRKWFNGFFSTGSMQNPLERP